MPRNSSSQSSTLLALPSTSQLWETNSNNSLSTSIGLDSISELSSSSSSSSSGSSSSSSSESISGSSSSASASTSFHTHAQLSSSSLESSSSSCTEYGFRNSTAVRTAHTSSVRSTAESSSSTAADPSTSETEPAAVPIYATSTTDTAEEYWTYYYSQSYYITDSVTTFTTALPTMTVVNTDTPYTPSSQEIITTDLSFLAANAALPTSNTHAKSNTGSKTGTIAGSVVGGGCAVLLAVALLWLWRRQRRRRSAERGFSHSIQSTRRYDEDLFGEKPTEKRQNWLMSIIPSLKRSKPHRSDHSNGSSTDGLGDLGSSILQEQQLQELNRYAQPYVPQRQPVQGYRMPRTIDTVMEENETPSPEFPAAVANPFEELRETAGPRRAPPAPPARRTTAAPVEFHRHGNNRHSVTSVESSVVSEGDSSDESLLLNEGRGGGLFHETV